MKNDPAFHHRVCGGFVFGCRLADDSGGIQNIGVDCVDYRVREFMDSGAGNQEITVL